MEDVDFPRAWLRLKAYIGSKRGHGQDDLFAEMSRIEVECSTSQREVPMARPGEGSTRSTSKNGHPSTPAAAAAGDDAPETATPPKEDTHVRRNGQDAREPAGAR